MAQQNNWSAKSALTTKELECLTSIGNLFKKPQKMQPIPQHPLIEQMSENKDQDIVEASVQEATQVIKEQEQVMERTNLLITKLDYHKGIVLASTKDFQDSCVSILKREQMLTRVVREVESNLQYYKDYEEITRILQTSSIIERPQEMVAAIGRVGKALEFFGVNFEFKKADIMLRRFEGLRDQLLEKITLKMVKTLREYNRDLTLRVLHTRVFDDDKDTLDPAHTVDYLYPLPSKSTANNKLQEDQQIVQSLAQSLSYQQLEAKVFSGEYFDHRLYLIELYLDHLQRHSLAKHPTLEGFISTFLHNFANLVQLEETYFKQWFGPQLEDRFAQFMRESEYEHMLHKRLRPEIIGNADTQALCKAIDFFRKQTRSVSPQRMQEGTPNRQYESDTILLGKESRERLMSDLQERLLLVSHSQLQEHLDTPTVFECTQDNLASMIPLPVLAKAKDILLSQLLPPRISPDIHRGLLLECVYRILHEHLLPLPQSDLPTLLITHANLYILKSELLSTSPDMLTEASDEGLDLSKTGEQLWGLLSGSFSHYESVLDFIDESIPKLKVKQQEDLQVDLEQRLYAIAQKIHQVFLRQCMDMGSDEQFGECMVKMGGEYQKMKEWIGVIEEAIGQYGVYEGLKTDIRVKAISRVQEYYQKVAESKGERYVEEMREKGVFKGIKEINREVFKCVSMDLRSESGNHVVEGEAEEFENVIA
ncbi:hypothetical protein FGO68_gene5236 [Halteria grandinella]|uniref:Conserved oligomeric Golgi complex subunit 3 N-terminal domain-containing protein n=1 Tax=Halteria grandinella TaxID=5974 RepID=A0A8J8NUT3_HALGN|nr:hypothetical protein FGO68_gene5236 [Halteria grandinella]